MNRWLLRIAVIVCALAVALTGTWWGWRKWWAVEQLVAAVEAGDVSRTRLLLTWGADPDAHRHRHRNIEYEVFDGGNLGTLRLPQSFTLSQSMRPSEDATILHVAAYQGNEDLVSVILAHKPDLEVRDGWTRTPLLYALMHNRPEVVALLVSAGADVNTPDLRGLTPLHYASWKPEMERILLGAGAIRYPFPFRTGSEP